MDANTVIALCATVIAVCSLLVSYKEAHATREHNRKSVRPILEIWQLKNYYGSTTGVKLINNGLGPAVITGVIVKLDGEVLGGWSTDTFEEIAKGLPDVPKVSTLRNGTVYPPGAGEFLLHFEDFDEAAHSWFWSLISKRITFEIHYESIYGGEGYKVVR
ncbi:hypothetical protein [Actinomadura sp. 7K534]|uniref:hypothetical protein n=1 Tax=Actinomadura sp. 7K534 TaxID=2530366 RepID=UPI00104F03FF|nr:hypothetical protein [Actinomadura sp. 7K534]TDB86432.1 hypothetical protein E1266_34195 [Actinomadura sp. 7K534]